MISQSYYAYILYSFKDRKLYLGSTSNLKQRLKQHNTGQVASTEDRRPLKLIHYEYFINKADALAREKYLKSGYGHDQLNSFLQRTMKSLIH